MDSPSAVEFPLTPEPDAGEIWRLTDALSLSRDPSAKGDDNNGNSEDWISLKEAISDTFSRADRLMNVFAHVWDLHLPRTILISSHCELGANSHHLQQQIR